MAHAAGATVFAIVFTDGPFPEETAARLGRAGADKVLLCDGPGLGAPPLDATHGGALYAAVQRIPPLLVLFPAGGAGRELGPGLAARLGGAFASTADLELGMAAVALADGVGRVFLRRWDRVGAGYRRLDPVDLERPVVAILPTGHCLPELGSGDVEVEVIGCPPTAATGVVELASEPDDEAAIGLAPVLVVVAPGASATTRAAFVRATAAGVAVVDAESGAAALAGAAPKILIKIGSPEIPVATTPQSRIGSVVVGGASGATSARSDVVWTVAGDSAAAWAELDAALGAVAPSRQEGRK